MFSAVNKVKEGSEDYFFFLLNLEWICFFKYIFLASFLLVSYKIQIIMVILFLPLYQMCNINLIVSKGLIAGLYKVIAHLQAFISHNLMIISHFF